MLHQEIVQPRVLLEHALAKDVAPLHALVHDERIPLSGELAFHARQHALHGAAVGVALGHRSPGVDVLEVLQENEALLEDLSRRGLEDRQRRRAVRLGEQPGWARLRDVDDMEIDFAAAALQRQQDFEALRERTDRDVVDG